MLVFASVLILALSFKHLSEWLKIAVSIALIGATLGNLLVSLKPPANVSQANILYSNGNQTNRALIQEIESRGLNKGYGNYWQSVINTYLTGGKINVLPVTCDSAGITTKLYWLIDNASFDATASKSFYIHDKTIATPAMCSPEELEKQFGKKATCPPCY